MVKRSRRSCLEPEPAPSPAQLTEKTVIAALRLGDVKKALQLLNSAPIAPKTEATLQKSFIQQVHRQPRSLSIPHPNLTLIPSAPH